ncbi:hypothetical protein J3E61_003401 [Mycobacterium sp. OAE908]
MQAVELRDTPHRGFLQEWLRDAGAVYTPGQSQGGRCAASAQLRNGSTFGLQPPHVGMADEAPGARAGENHRVDARIAIDAVYQLIKLVRDVDPEQAVRPTVDPYHQDGTAVLDL